MAPAWMEYAAGVSLGSDEDGEMRVHTDDQGNLWLCGWRAESESGEMQRDPEYDGALGPTQAEALRVLLNEQAGATAIGTKVRVPLDWWYGSISRLVDPGDRVAVVTALTKRSIELRHISSGRASRNQTVEDSTLLELLDAGSGPGEVLP